MLLGNETCVDFEIVWQVVRARGGEEDGGGGVRRVLLAGGPRCAAPPPVVQVTDGEGEGCVTVGVPGCVRRCEM